MVDELIVILTYDTDYTVKTVLTDGYKTYHITSEAWTIRGVQNPNYTVLVCICVVKFNRYSWIYAVDYNDNDFYSASIFQQ